MMGLLQIDEKCTCRSDAKRIGVYSKALKGIYLELPCQLGDGVIIDEGPFLKGRDVEMVSIAFSDTFFISSRNEKFLRGE